MAADKISWSDIKRSVSDYGKEEFIRLIGDLYSLNQENKRFLESRCIPSPDRLTPYKEIISDAVFPDMYSNKPIRLSVGKKAISDYKKATHDPVGVIELMVYFLESGTGFTVAYGDIDGPFYSSIGSMMKSIIDALLKSGPDVQDMFIPRLKQVVLDARGIGWGYYDEISFMLGAFLGKR